VRDAPFKEGLAESLASLFAEAYGEVVRCATDLSGEEVGIAGCAMERDVKENFYRRVVVRILLFLVRFIDGSRCSGVFE
jgi:hypothetical protein